MFARGRRGASTSDLVPEPDGGADAAGPALDPTADGGGGPGARRLQGRDVLVVVAAVAVACQLGAAASHGRDIVDATRRAFDEPPRTLRGADLTPLSSFASTQALLLARETIPPDATFAVVVGDRVERGEEVAVAFQNLLVPRRRTSLDEADWVIAYRTPVRSLGVDAARVVDLGPRADAVEVARP